MIQTNYFMIGQLRATVNCLIISSVLISNNNNVHNQSNKYSVNK